MLDGETVTVEGVLRAPFFFPFAMVSSRFRSRRKLIRSAASAGRCPSGGRRLRPGISRDRVREAMTAIAARLQRDYPDTNARKVSIT